MVAALPIPMAYKSIKESSSVLVKTVVVLWTFCWLLFLGASVEKGEFGILFSLVFLGCFTVLVLDLITRFLRTTADKIENMEVPKPRVKSVSKPKTKLATPKGRSVAKDAGNELDLDDLSFEEHAYQSPIPADERKKVIVNGLRYYVIWEGTTPEVALSINRKKHTHIFTHFLVRDCKVHLANLSKDEAFVVSKESITSQLKTDGWGSCTLYDWMRRFHDLPPYFMYKYIELESYESDYETIWEGELPPTTFSRYEQINNERQRVKESLVLVKVQKGKISNRLYTSFQKGSDVLRLSSDDILTMLVTEGHKKYRFDDWINEVVKVPSSRSSEETIKTGEIPESVE